MGSCWTNSDLRLVGWTKEYASVPFSLWAQVIGSPARTYQLGINQGLGLDK